MAKQNNPKHAHQSSLSSKKKAVERLQKSPASASHAPKSDDVRATVRIYRQGLGDCILIRLKRKNGADFKILIDCGVAVATTDASEKMTKVVQDIISATGGKIDVLAVTHEHWDHVSGFSQAEDEFKKMTVDEVWVAWTEDPTDPLAKTLRGERSEALRTLHICAQGLAISGQTNRAQGVLDVLSMNGAKGEKTGAAFDIAKSLAKGRKPQYWRPTNQPFRVPSTEINIYALGPPHDAKLIRKILPSKSNPETYELALDGSGVFPAGVWSALSDADDLPPFADNVAIPFEWARNIEFFQSHYFGALGESDSWRRIDADWLNAAEDLALALQSATNNTSLVLAIELPGGDVLLFAGDAQVGNWLSWQDLKWPENNPKTTGPDLLSRTIFYKVGHHGSHNATLREKGLELMKNLRFAVIPVDHEVALKMRWGDMPLESLITALNKVTGGKTLRTDFPPSGQITSVAVTELYYEISV